MKRKLMKKMVGFSKKLTEDETNHILKDLDKSEIKANHNMNEISYDFQKNNLIDEPIINSLYEKNNKSQSFIKKSKFHII